MLNDIILTPSYFFSTPLFLFLLFSLSVSSPIFSLFILLSPLNVLMYYSQSAVLP